MLTEVVMPKLGLNMSEGMIVEWLKREGDYVRPGDLLFVVETDKITSETEAQVEGIIKEILVLAGDVVPVSTPLAIISVKGSVKVTDDVPKPSPVRKLSYVDGEEQLGTNAARVIPSAKVLASPAAKRLAAEHGLDLSLIPGTGRLGSISKNDVARYLVKLDQKPIVKPLASPLAKRVARELGVDLAVVTGTGRNGQITRADVERASAKPIRSETDEHITQRIPVEGVRAVIAERMLLSTQQTAQLTLHTEVDATNLVKLRQSFKKKIPSSRSEIPSFNAILISIIAKALEDYPYVNARLDGNTILVYKDINIGLALDTKRGLVVVVIRNANSMTTIEIEEQLIDLIERAQQGTSKLDDLTGSTFTITNLGKFGVDNFTPILNPPEIGILGVGRIIEKPVMLDGHVCGRPMMALSLTFDHRVIDGAPAARFLQHVAQLIELEQTYLS